MPMLSDVSRIARTDRTTLRAYMLCARFPSCLGVVLVVRG
jgi:hypothetical protein